MVHGIIYFVLLAIIIATNTYHYKVERKQNAELDYWREACVKERERTQSAKRETT